MPVATTSRMAIAIISAGCVLAVSACSGDGARITPEDRTAPERVADRVTAHLLRHGARRARSDHPERHWFRGSLVLPGGGATCAVAGVAVGAHAPLVTDAVYDASGTVSVRIRAAERDRARCLAAARRALAGLDVAGGS